MRYTKNGFPIFTSFSEANEFTTNSSGRDQIARHEGYAPEPYEDNGQWTAGFGTRIGDMVTMDKQMAIRKMYAMSGTNETSDPEERKEAMQAQMGLDYHRIDTEMEDYIQSQGIKANPIQKRVINNMAYMLGTTGVKSFKKMFAALKKGDTTQAAYEILNSKMSTQVKDRALELWSMMRHSNPDEEQA